MEESYQKVGDSSFLPILSGLCVFSEYSCVEPRKAARKGITYMKKLITIILALIMMFFSAPQKGADQPHVTVEKTPQTAITATVEQVPEESEKPAETAFVSEVAEAETMTEAPKKETPVVQETVTE